MRKLLAPLAVLGVAATALPASAALLSTNGSPSSTGAKAAIIAAPANVNDDQAYNEAIQAFNEVIGYTLTADLAVDGDTIAKGTRVDSHMIFLNSGPGNNRALIEHGFNGDAAATFTFDGTILGVMSNSNGSFEVASSSFLGASGTIYPTSPFGARGLENDPLIGTNDDYYSVNCDTITVGLRVTEPGDWMRVVTVSQVPLPAGLPLFLAALAGLGFLARRRAV